MCGRLNTEAGGSAAECSVQVRADGSTLYSRLYIVLLYSLLGALGSCIKVLECWVSGEGSTEAGWRSEKERGGEKGEIKEDEAIGRERGRMQEDIPKREEAGGNSEEVGGNRREEGSRRKE